MKFPVPVSEAASTHPYPLLFATISGAHLYGFPSPDSDWDIRGVHVLPFAKMAGFTTEDETVEVSRVEAELELDLVSHDIKKFFQLMLKRNGYVLEQLYSPLVVLTTPEHEELKAIGKNCITRHHCHHYLGFADNQWKLFRKDSPPRIKPLLYVFRVLLTGIHLMKTGEIEANISRLNESFGLSYLGELIERKVSTAEKNTLEEVDLHFYETQFATLRSLLEEAGRVSTLPDAPSAGADLDFLLRRIRMAKGLVGSP